MNHIEQILLEYDYKDYVSSLHKDRSISTTCILLIFYNGIQLIHSFTNF